MSHLGFYTVDFVLGLLGLLEKALAPVYFLLTLGLILRLNGSFLLVLNLLRLLLSNVCLISADFFILFFCATIDFARTLITHLTHLFSHNLTERARAATVRKDSLRFLINFFLRFELHAL
jgi:hypothetical protein